MGMDICVLIRANMSIACVGTYYLLPCLLRHSMIFQHGTFYSKVPYEFVPKCRRKLGGQGHSRRKERLAWEAALLPWLQSSP